MLFRSLVLLWPDGEEAVFEGTLPGHVTWPPRGLEGHGYDPIFVPEGHDVTLGEMPPEQKNALSHRARALVAMKEAMDAP